MMILSILRITPVVLIFSSGLPQLILWITPVKHTNNLIRCALNLCYFNTMLFTIQTLVMNMGNIMSKTYSGTFSSEMWILIHVPTLQVSHN